THPNTDRVLLPAPQPSPIHFPAHQSPLHRPSPGHRVVLRPHHQPPDRHRQPRAQHPAPGAPGRDAVPVLQEPRLRQEPRLQLDPVRGQQRDDLATHVEWRRP
ncbi:hypothetical protein BGZ52_010358, partial [Haplosporangium bisporale]